MAKILIADDEGDLRNLFGLCFLRRGHSIVVASNGAEALRCLATHQPDLLVTDMNMPVMDGLELLNRLRANGQCAASLWDRDLPVIVLTAQSDQRAAASAAGANAFLVKPVPLRLLGEVAERLLAERYAACVEA